jgi:hypothetical protein
LGAVQGLGMLLPRYRYRVTGTDLMLNSSIPVRRWSPYWPEAGATGAAQQGNPDAGAGVPGVQLTSLVKGLSTAGLLAVLSRHRCAIVVS